MHERRSFYRGQVAPLLRKRPLGPMRRRQFLPLPGLERPPDRRQHADVKPALLAVRLGVEVVQDALREIGGLAAELVGLPELRLGAGVADGETVPQPGAEAEPG